MADRVFLLGAGFSKAICHEMPTMEELGLAVEAALKREGRPIPKSMSQFGDDFEQLLSHLAEGQPWLDPAEVLRNRAAFLDVSRAVAQVIGERQMVAVQATEPTWMGDLIGHWDRMQSTVLTFNYDVLVEAAAVPRARVES